MGALVQVNNRPRSLERAARNGRQFASSVAPAQQPNGPSSHQSTSNPSGPTFKNHKLVSASYLRRFIRKELHKLVKHEAFFVHVLRK